MRSLQFKTPWIGAALALGACSQVPPEELGSVHVKSGDVTKDAGGKLEVTQSDHAGLAGVAIEVPSDAVPANTRLTIDAVTAAIVDADADPAGPTAKFGPAGLTFAKPVTITLPFTGALDVDHARVFVVSENGAREVLMPAALTIDAAAKRVRFQVSHFTSFQVGRARQACAHVADCASGNCQAGVCVEDGCDPNECTGPAPGAPTVMCDDGTTAGPECARDASGACQWTVTTCEDECDCGPPPPVARCPDGNGPTVACFAENGVCSWHVSRCATTCDPANCGPMPPVARCPDGMGPSVTCEPDASGACAWNVGSCNLTCDPAECGPSRAWACADGSEVPASCERDPAGGCAWQYGTCPAICDPNDCGPIPPVAPCPDGMGPSVTCEPDAAGACGWHVGTCNLTCDPAECGPSRAWACADGSEVPSSCERDPASGTCGWVYGECPIHNCGPTTSTTTNGGAAPPAPNCWACMADSDCAPGYTCVGGFCEVAQATCRARFDCQPGEDCINGACVPAMVECRSDSDCRATSEVCVDGECVAPPPCRTDQECGVGQVCTNGMCTPETATCGNTVCPAGTACCNASCGICAPPGSACTQQACSPCPMGCAAGEICDASTGACVPAECPVTSCGPAPGLANWMCDNGEVGGPTGRCVYVDFGVNQCGWEINWCTRSCDPSDCGPEPTDPPTASCMDDPDAGPSDGGSADAGTSNTRPAVYVCQGIRDGSCAWVESCN